MLKGGDLWVVVRKDIVKAAIQLPENERVLVVEQLLASLEAAPDENVDAAWEAEIERRSRDGGGVDRHQRRDV